MESLIYLTPLGLALDIIGFLIVIEFGHNIFMRFDKEPPDPGDGRDGQIHWQSEGGTNIELRRRAYVGVCIVVVGFVFQIVGSVAVIANY